MGKNGGIRPGAGREVGSQLLRINLEMRQAILKAAKISGGAEGLVGYLVEQSKANPPAFMALLGKCTSTNSDLKELGDALPRVIVTIRDLLKEERGIINGEIISETTQIVSNGHSDKSAS